MGGLTVNERIARGEQAIARAKAMGANVPAWENHLERLKIEAELEALKPMVLDERELEILKHKTNEELAWIRHTKAVFGKESRVVK